METALYSATSIDRRELPSIMATLCSYENWFGPYHPQTLCLMAQVAIAFWQSGESNYARPLLERVVRDAGRHLGRAHDVYLGAVTALRDLLVAQREYTQAAAVQTELLECQTIRLGGDHPETRASRAHLSRLMLENVTGDSNMEC
jgi:hypothetical protein